MIEFIKNLQRRWNDWCGDREMELAIRRHLTAEGFFGNAAKLSNVRLVAVQRPGWIQVFRFDAQARVRPDDRENEDGPDAPAQYETLYGLLRDDARGSKTSIRTVTRPEDRKELFVKWSDGLICLRGAQGL